MTIAFGQSTRAQSRAHDGESVLVIPVTVKAGKQQQYEHFVHDIFWGGIKNLTSQDQKKTFQSTRILHPSKANADGTYTYMFIMDPVIKGANYEMPSLLEKMYGKAKGAEYYTLYTDIIYGCGNGQGGALSP